MKVFIFCFGNWFLFAGFVDWHTYLIHKTSLIAYVHLCITQIKHWVCVLWVYSSISISVCSRKFFLTLLIKIYNQAAGCILGISTLKKAMSQSGCIGNSSSTPSFPSVANEEMTAGLHASPSTTSLPPLPATPSF
ncbi:PREDICTED: uncharacterized protein LOC101300700 isoform 1 [Fragaria vesca subsp. vesca]